MDNNSIESKIRRMSQYLDDEAVARALNVEVDLVRGVLNGEVKKVAEEEKRPGVKVTQYLRPAFRQRVIYIARVKGGVGATTLALNLAWRVSEKAKVLVVDTQAEVLNQTVFSDFLDLARVGSYSPSGGELEICEVSDNLHYMPFLQSFSEHDFDRIILEARRDYDVIIVDLPVVRDAAKLKSAMVILYVYGGGEAEGARMFRLINEDAGRNTAYVSLVPKHSLYDEARWIYLPASDRPGVFDVKSPAGKAVAEIIGEIWGRELLEGPRESLIDRILKRK